MADYLTVAEVAKKLGKTTETIRNYIKEGKLKGRKINGEYGVLPEDLEEFLKPAPKTEELDKDIQAAEKRNRLRQLEIEGKRLDDTLRSEEDIAQAWRKIDEAINANNTDKDTLAAKAEELANERASFAEETQERKEALAERGAVLDARAVEIEEEYTEKMAEVQSHIKQSNQLRTEVTEEINQQRIELTEWEARLKREEEEIKEKQAKVNAAMEPIQEARADVEALITKWEWHYQEKGGEGEHQAKADVLGDIANRLKRTLGF